MTAPVNAAGFFGKVVAHADFVSRRVPPAFLQRWDGWLQAAMHAARERAGAGWPSAYLAGPTWRFVLAQESCDAHAWAGVLMPSSDSVGRQFPLTIVTRLVHGADVLACLRDGDDWYGALEALAMSTASGGFVLAEFDLALSGLPAAPQSGEDSVPDIHLSEAVLDRSSASLPSLAALFSPLFLQGHSLWWNEGRAGGAASLMICKGMPQPPAMAEMLTAQTRQPGRG